MLLKIIFLFPETGTSTIQEQINTNKEIRHNLKLDNILVIPHEMIHRQDFANRTNDGSFSFSSDFVELMRLIKASGRYMHILGSSEYIPGPKGNDAGCESWKEVLYDNKNGMHWNLHIVITYRRHYDFLPSHWNQRYRKNPDKWPEEGGNVIPSFDEYLIDHLVRAKKKGSDVLGGAFYQYNNWKLCSDSISLVHYHDSKVGLPNGTTIPETDLLTSFVCNGVVGATHTCSFLLDKLTQGGLPTKRKNPSADLGYEMLAVHAHESGLIPNVWERLDVVQKIKQFSENTNTSNILQIRCPNATILQQLYDYSLEGEKWAITVIGNHTKRLDTLNDKQLQKFDLDWKRWKDSQKSCTIDVDLAVETDEWKDFFRKAFNRESATPKMSNNTKG